MRIAYIINGLNGGGAAFPIPDLVRVMRDRGHAVRVFAIAPQDRRGIPRLEAAGVDYRIAGRGYAGGALWPGALLGQLRRFGPDVLWTSLTRATVAGQLLGRMLALPVVSWQHNAFLRPANRRMLRLTRGLSELWITDSEAVSEFAVEALRIPPQRIECWPLFRADASRPASQPWEAGPFRIGSLGRLHPNKRYEDLLAAAARLRQLDPELAARVEFEVAGEGPERERLERRRDELGLRNFAFVGFQGAPRFLASLHAYVQCSHHEGLCIAAHEAMCAALPIVATPVGQVPWTLREGGLGRLVPIGDIDALARRLRELALATERAATLGRACRERVLSRFGAGAFDARGAAILRRVEGLVEDGRRSSLTVRGRGVARRQK